MKLIGTRCLGGKIRAYHTLNGVYGRIEPAATYEVKCFDKKMNYAVAPNLARAVYTTPHSVVCINQDSDMLWHYDLEPRSTQRYLNHPSCAFSLDGAWVWVYCPDVMADRGPDILVVLRADTGQEVARTELDSVGQGASFALHPDGRYILLDVGEGQDGVKLYRAALTGNEIDLHSYGWDDRCLVDVAPHGQWFMTVDHGQHDVAFHVFLSGDVVLREPVESFSDEDLGDDEAIMNWNGGFLNADVAVVTIVGEKDDKEWHRHYSIELRTGTSPLRFEAYSLDSYDFEPLGDSTWIVSGPDNSLIRYRFSTTG